MVHSRRVQVWCYGQFLANCTPAFQSNHPHATTGVLLARRWLADDPNVTGARQRIESHRAG